MARHQAAQNRRKLNLFPEGFAIRPTQDEWAALRSQIVILATGQT